MNHPEYPAAVAACGEGWLEYHRYRLTDVMGLEAAVVGYGYRTEEGRNVRPWGWEADVMPKYYVLRDDAWYQTPEGLRCYHPRYEVGWENLTPDEAENRARVAAFKDRRENPLLAFIEEHGRHE